MKAVVAAFNQEKALVGAFSVITNLRMELFEALTGSHPPPVQDLRHLPGGRAALQSSDELQRRIRGGHEDGQVQLYR